MRKLILKVIKYKQTTKGTEEKKEKGRKGKRKVERKYVVTNEFLHVSIKKRCDVLLVPVKHHFAREEATVCGFAETDKGG